MEQNLLGGRQTALAVRGPKPFPSQRVQGFELEDQDWMPRSIRESIPEMLGLSSRWSGIYRQLAPLFRQALDRVGSDRVLDLCSGSGEPIGMLLDALKAQNMALPEVTMSDLYPNVAALERVASRHPDRISVERESVDATALPAHLRRPLHTVINALHHFPPQLAQPQPGTPPPILARMAAARS